VAQSRPGWKDVGCGGRHRRHRLRIALMAAAEKMKRTGAMPPSRLRHHAQMLGEASPAPKRKTRRRLNGSAAMPRPAVPRRDVRRLYQSPSASATSPISIKPCGGAPRPQAGWTFSLPGIFQVEVPGLDTLYDAYSFKLLPKSRYGAQDEESIAISAKASPLPAPANSPR